MYDKVNHGPSWQKTLGRENQELNVFKPVGDLHLCHLWVGCVGCYPCIAVELIFDLVNEHVVKGGILSLESGMQTKI